MGIKRYAAIAACGVAALLLAGCGSDDKYWGDAAKDACQKSIAHKTLDPDPTSAIRPAADGRARRTWMAQRPSAWPS